MIEVLTFIFSGFWVFVGTLFLVSAVLGGIARIVQAATCRAKCGDHHDNTTRD